MYLLWSGILFLTAVRAVVVAKLNIGCFVFNFVYLNIKSSSSSCVSNTRYFVFNLIYTSYVFFNNIIFTRSLSLLESPGAGTNLSTSN